jgi:hypothetical protein
MIVKFDEFIAKRYEKIRAEIERLEKERSELVMFKVFRSTMVKMVKERLKLGGEQMASYVALLNKLGLKALWPDEQEEREFLDELDIFQQKTFEELEELDSSSDQTKP